MKCGTFPLQEEPFHFDDPVEQIRLTFVPDYVYASTES